MMIAARRDRRLSLLPAPLPEKQSGFTLLELLVVLVIIAMSASFVGPRMWHSYEKGRERAVVQSWGHSILALRQQAFHSGRAITLDNAASRNRYGVRLAQDWRLLSADRIVLLPSGVTSGGQFDLASPTLRHWKLILQPFDGQMRIERQ